MFLDDHYRTRSLRLEMGSIPASEYPFFNPRELAGAGPYAVGLGFYEDYVQMNIEYDASLSAARCWSAWGWGQVSPGRRVLGLARRQWPCVFRYRS